ncbi:MAG TPA: restriction endonuclease [Verrucomicrobiae bacterium]|nr:restriction endonuclease [Verrucomicrobiae bacterium]
MKPHPDARELKRLFPAVREYQKLAIKHGIPDIFQDNGGKILQVCLVLGLTVLKSREGNDAVDAEGNEYELKTVNLLRTDQFSTHHHLNPVIIKKYRKVDWIFSTYEAIELKETFLLKRATMEYWYKRWSAKWKADGGRDINNPKVPLSFVRKHGKQLYSSVGEDIEDTIPAKGKTK